MSSIDWEIQNTEMPAIDRPLLERWIVAVAVEHGRIIGALVYIFCDDERIIEVNREFLQHDYYTDIITFDYSRRKLISGDMFISLDTVASNAERLGWLRRRTAPCDYTRRIASLRH